MKKVNSYWEINCDSCTKRVGWIHLEEFEKASAYDEKVFCNHCAGSRDKKIVFDVVK